MRYLIAVIAIALLIAKALNSGDREAVVMDQKRIEQQEELDRNTHYGKFARVEF